MTFSIGQVAMGKNFWDREFEIEDIWETIENGGHALLSAPRRVGKTSIMRKIESEPRDGYIVIYLDTESADNENEFWKKMYLSITKEDFVNKFKSNSNKLFDFLKNIRLKKVTVTGIEFDEGKVLDFEESFKKVIESLGEDIKLVIMIDEFAQTVENIIKYEDEKKALSLLKSHHTIRMDKKSFSNISLVYAGSIGLESVVHKIHGTKYINDLTSIKVSPLEFDDAKKFIDKLLENQKFKMDNIQKEYLLNKIEWLIPFYIQLILDEVRKLYRRNPNISTDVIDTAIQNAIEHRNYFDHWQTKLKEAFDKNSYLFAKEVLNIISENSTITSSEISNISVKYKLSDDIKKDVINSLKYDGYINNNDNSKEYIFNSPILKIWWNKNVAN
jgi:hypothetical protein